MLQRLVTLVQEGGILITLDKADVRHAVDKQIRIVQHAILDLVRSELARNLKRFADLNRFTDINGAVGFFWRIVQFHKGRVAGARVIPAVGAFFGNLISRRSTIVIDQSGCSF